VDVTSTPSPEIDEAKFSALLCEFAWTLATDFPIGSILDHLVVRIVELLPVSAAGVTLIAGDHPHYVASSDGDALCYERLQSELAEGPCVSSHHSGEPVSVPDLDCGEGRFERFTLAARAAGLRAVFAFPLRYPGGRFGALDLYRNSPGPLSVRAMEVAQTLADVAAAYVLNAQARQAALSNAEKHRHLALHDPLTGLPNRLLLRDRFRHAALRAQRSNAPTAVLFVDLDRFKRVNDALGHQAGDQLLIAVGKRLSKLIRPGDTLARLAGDEFVVLCEDLDRSDDADLIGERVARSFLEPFVIEGVTLHMSASVGWASAGPGQPINDQLLARADAAMYTAKAQRRLNLTGPATDG
jgi:diguanylate cyclase (GGDEF)-like protein